MAEQKPPGEDIDPAAAVAAEVAPAVVVPLELAPMSIQAASLVRAIDGLSRIFVFTIAATFLTGFFAALVGLESNANSAAVAIGEYEVPKSVLPWAGVLVSLSLFWLTSNRLGMLGHILHRIQLPRATVHELFHLNAPVLHVFEAANLRSWAPLTGVSVLFVVWAGLIGNTAAIALRAAVQLGVATSQPQLLELLLLGLMLLGTAVYGYRSVVPPLQRILSELHDVDFRIGWQRKWLVLGIVLALIGIVNADQIRDPSGQTDRLLGPGTANAMDGSSLWMAGQEVSLLGVRAPLPDQECLDAQGKVYNCGRAATRALQRLVQGHQVICFPLFRVNALRVAATCQQVLPGAAMPTHPDDFVDGHHANDLALLQASQGHAVAAGLGRDSYGEAERAAQVARLGMWQGAVTPPRSRSFN